jgi:hypothetical protein
MRLTLPDEDVSDVLIHLATEDGLSVEDFIKKLAQEEDRRRHVRKPPFEDEIRTQCGRELCSEERPMLSAVDAERT